MFVVRFLNCYSNIFCDTCDKYTFHVTPHPSNICGFHGAML